MLDKFLKNVCRIISKVQVRYDTVYEMSLKSLLPFKLFVRPIADGSDKIKGEYFLKNDSKIKIMGLVLFINLSIGKLMCKIREVHTVRTCVPYIHITKGSR